MQKIDNKQYLLRYKSNTWSLAEQKYNATKRKCRNVLKAFKKFRHYFYGIHFVLETDASMLVTQLNCPGVDLPGVLITRWLAWIWLFDFKVKHVPGRKHTAADGLSQRLAVKGENNGTENIDEFIAAKLNSIHVNPIALDEAASEFFLHDGYSKRSFQIAAYLTIL